MPARQYLAATELSLPEDDLRQISEPTIVAILFLGEKEGWLLRTLYSRTGS